MITGYDPYFNFLRAQNGTVKTGNVSRVIYLVIGIKICRRKRRCEPFYNIIVYNNYVSFGSHFNLYIYAFIYRYIILIFYVLSALVQNGFSTRSISVPPNADNNNDYYK